MPSDLAMARMLEEAQGGRRAVWVRVEATRGSAPREAGASMLVGEAFIAGTIGGGHLEHQAVSVARATLGAPTAARAFARELALGPSLGQCCGGSVTLAWRVVDRDEAGWVAALARAERDGATIALATSLSPGCVPHSRVAADHAVPADWRAGPGIVSRLEFRPWHVWVFGAGHVGEAVVRIVATLPATVVWVDPRASQFPAALPDGVTALVSDSPAHEVDAMPGGADVLVMTHSHAIDFDLCVALTARDDLGWCGVIGSRTKAIRFARRLAQRGVDPVRIARLQCPIGTPAPSSAARDPWAKHPGAIALDVVLQLWRRRCGATDRGATVSTSDFAGSVATGGR
jgi:xanthine dehydrogenase accessory factor